MNRRAALLESINRTGCAFAQAGIPDSMFKPEHRMFSGFTAHPEIGQLGRDQGFRKILPEA
jgi:hypothetical protein